jgi:uncharacterized membrane protein YhaH (DUF805 family)
VRLYQLLFGFSGRLGRGDFEIAVVIYCVVYLVLGLMISILLFAFDLHRVSVKGTIPLLVLLTPMSAKRLHDRDKSGWWLLAFYAFPAASSYVDDVEGTGLPYLFSLVRIVFSLWGFVELGCLRGTPGPNRFGPNPLAG